jgi:DNA-binding transcriptional LysR family regulator
MRYTLDQLMTFDAVARLGSFSAAAREIQRSPSAVSMAMSNLEVDMNVPLFVRSPRQVSLTGQGEALREYARVVLESYNTLERRVDAFNQQIERSISLAIAIPYGFISPVLYDFSIAFPEVDIHIREPLHGDVEAMVHSGEAHLGIALTRAVDADRIQFRQLGKLTMVHVFSTAHPLAQRIPVSFADLHQYRHIAFGRQQRPIATTEYLTSPSIWRMESYGAILEATLAGLGWASLPHQFVRRELERGTLVELRQQEYPHTDWLVGVDLLWSRLRAEGKAQHWLRKRLVRDRIFEQDAPGKGTQ